MLGLETDPVTEMVIGPSPIRLTSGSTLAALAAVIASFRSLTQPVSGGIRVTLAGIPGPEPGWITTLDWIATIGFAIAAAFWLYRYFAYRKPNPGTNTVGLWDWGTPCHAFMAAGMAIMFGVML